MTERKRMPITTQNVAEAPISATERQMEARENVALKKIFSYLEENALRTGKPVDLVTHEIPMIVTNSSGQHEFTLVVNPSIVENGKLTVAIFDLYHDELGEEDDDVVGSHIIQWVAKATWDKDKIIGMKTNLNVVNGAEQRINLADVAEYVSRKFEQQMGIEEQSQQVAETSEPSISINVPRGYVRGIN